MTLDIETDFANIELCTLAALLPWQQEIIDRLGREEARIAIDPAKPGSDKTVVVVGHGAEFFIVDEFDLHIDNSLAQLGDRLWASMFGEQKVTGTVTVSFEDEEALRKLLASKPSAEDEKKKVITRGPHKADSFNPKLSPAEITAGTNRSQRRAQAAKFKRKF